MSERGKDGGVLSEMRLEDVLIGWRVGSADWGWAAEFKDRRRNCQGRLDQLATSIQETGMREPILLGSDGRVWDGHHRICAALMLALETVPVEILDDLPPVPGSSDRTED